MTMPIHLLQVRRSKLILFVVLLNLCFSNHGFGRTTDTLGGNATVAASSEYRDVIHQVRKRLFSDGRASKSRGSVYDPVLGICCHFCRSSAASRLSLLLCTNDSQESCLFLVGRIIQASYFKSYFLLFRIANYLTIELRTLGTSLLSNSGRRNYAGKKIADGVGMETLISHA